MSFFNRDDDFINTTHDKKYKAVKFFNRCSLLLLLVILVSLALCFEKPYELERASAHGPALWFLHLTAWPLLFLPGVINSLTGIYNTAVMKYLIDDNPALILTLLACLLLGIIWVIFRRYGISWFGVSGLRSAGHFMLIFAGWGILQLLICAVIVLQDTNTLIPFHPVKPTQAVQKSSQL